MKDIENAGKSTIIRALCAKDAKTKYFVAISHLWENMKHIKPTDHFLLQPIFYQGKDTRAFDFSCAPTKHDISTKVHNDAMMD